MFEVLKFIQYSFGFFSDLFDDFVLHVLRSDQAQLVTEFLNIWAFAVVKLNWIALSEISFNVNRQSYQKRAAFVLLGPDKLYVSFQKLSDFLWNI